MPYVQDVNTLVACTALNHHFKQYTYHTVRLSAHALLNSWTQACHWKDRSSVSAHFHISSKSAAMARYGIVKQCHCKECKLHSLLWLCETMGTEFVNRHSTACSLLHILKVIARGAPELPAISVVETLKKAGQSQHTAPFAGQ